MPAMTALSRPVPSAPRTLIGSTRTPSPPMPAIPVPLSVAAATMPASQVPWPCGSVSAGEPSTNDWPGSNLPSRSGWLASTPVSRIATVAVPVGRPWACNASQPMRGSDHWSANRGSPGAASTSRLRSRSTLSTAGSAASAAASHDADDPSSSTIAIRRSGIEVTSTAPTAPSAADCSAALAALPKVTMQRADWAAPGAAGSGVGDASGAEPGSGVGDASGAGPGAGVGD